ncbi:MAG: acyl-CoA dehydrogenase family protein [Algiphilus sp.]|uniref:acyl-CoA dehydrogenase family protein n=1 Tax=Algiphilus sp. TaxID=1872431 RepID=UPI0032F01C52
MPRLRHAAAHARPALKQRQPHLLHRWPITGCASSLRPVAFDAPSLIESGASNHQPDQGCRTHARHGYAVVYAAEKATWATGQAIQALGGNGYINEYATGRLWRDAKLYEIGAGTSEIRRMLIGRELFGETR